MSLVNRYPAGLLGLFDTKSTGRTPPNFEDSLRGVVDVGPHFRASVGVTAAQEIENVAAGTFQAAFAAIPIPAGETWQVIAIASRVAHQTTESAWFNPCIIDVSQSDTAGDASGSPVTMSLGNPLWGFTYTAAAGTTQDYALLFPQPLIFQAPVQFGTWMHRNTFAAARNVTTQILYNQLD